MALSRDQAAHGRVRPNLAAALLDERYPYNDELLISDADKTAARELYPNIYPALDFPELRAVFDEVDPATNEAKRRSRFWGFVAVILVASSLIVASAERLYHGKGVIEVVMILLAAAAGVSGVILGLFGVLFAKSKRQWLYGRLITERLRQLHFQVMIALAPELLAAARIGDWGAYHERRKLALDAFAADLMPRAGLVLDDLVSADDAEAVSEHLCWLVETQDGGLGAEPHLAELFRAYRRLRLARQIDFCRLKLRSDHRIFTDAPKAQSARFTSLTIVCILALLGIHIALVLSLFPGWYVTVGAVAHLLVVWLAIAVLALRTLEEGLQPKREIERYRNYKSALENIAQRFDRAGDAAARFSAMRELEELAFDEMVNFLKSNTEAKFIM